MVSDTVNKVQVLICWHWDPLDSYPGGIGRVIKDMIQHSPDSFEFTVLTNTSERIKLHKKISYKIGGKTCTLIPIMTMSNVQNKLIPLRLKYMIAIRKYLKNHNITDYVIHFHGIEPWFGFGKLKKNSKVLFLHKDPGYRWEEISESYWRFIPKPIYDYLEAKVFNDIDKVYFVNKAAYRKYSQKYSVLKNKFSLISTWVDTGSFYPMPEDQREGLHLIRKEYGIPENCNLLFYYGRYDEIKNPLLLIRAIDLLKNKFDNIYLLMVGDGILKNKMIHLTNELHLEKYISIRGYQDSSFIRKVLWIADVTVLPSRKEGMSMAINESLGCGCPVVGFNVGEIERVVKPGKSGEIVYGEQSPENFASSLETVLKNLNYYNNARKDIANSIKQLTPWNVLKPVFEETELLSQHLK